MKFNKTLIIPCKEEGENFTTILKRFEENIKNDTEIIIVLDSVEDSTYKFIENAETKAKMIINPKAGVASAINFGIESAEGNFICIAMGDGSDDPTQVEDLFMLVERGLSVAIASRYSKGGQFIGNKNLKYFLSKYWQILKYILFLGTKDPTNMFKAYDKAFLKDVGIQSENGFTLGLEMTIKAKLNNYKIGEIPTIWIDDLLVSLNLNLENFTKLYLLGFKIVFRTK